MQFYIIHDDPKTNFDLLPTYATTKVNAREGMQILSDLGHLFNITWEGQNKPYSIWHAETRRFWRNERAFIQFLRHYRYHVDHVKSKTWKEKYHLFLKGKGPNKILKAIKDNGIKDEHSQMVYKLIHQKGHLMNEEELKRLKGL